MNKKILFVFTFLYIYMNAEAQENYEVQIYASQTMAPDMTILELHTNYTFDGQPQTGEVRPTEHSWHETIEITHGFNDWFELGFYLFTNIQPGYGLQYVGNHIRPRVRAPEAWGWPVGVSLSTEIGYQRKEYSADIWNMEIRPIVDKNFEKVYISFNPTIGKTFKGVNEDQGLDFDPGVKIAFHAGKKIDIGTEYYAGTGMLFNPDPIEQQDHMIYGVVDLFLAPELEFNAGMGWGLTDASEGQIFKLILGWRFGGQKTG